MHQRERPEVSPAFDEGGRRWVASSMDGQELSLAIAVGGKRLAGAVKSSELSPAVVATNVVEPPRAGQELSPERCLLLRHCQSKYSPGDVLWPSASPISFLSPRAPHVKGGSCGASQMEPTTCGQRACDQSGSMGGVSPVALALALLLGVQKSLVAPGQVVRISKPVLRISPSAWCRVPVRVRQLGLGPVLVGEELVTVVHPSPFAGPTVC